MIDIKVRDVFLISIVAVLVVAADTSLMHILLHSNPQASDTMILIVDFTSVLLLGSAGLCLAPSVECPIWWRAKDFSISRRQDIVILLLCTFVVVGNTGYNILVFPNQTGQDESWFSSLVLETAIAISFRAALNEEIIFRLFLFPLVSLIAKRVVHIKKALIVGALVSSFLFWAIHGFGVIWAFLSGLVLVYIFRWRGLFPVMIVHFFADAIPFILISS